MPRRLPVIDDLGPDALSAPAELALWRDTAARLAAERDALTRRLGAAEGRARRVRAALRLRRASSVPTG